ncbi:hypothetical protein EPA93_38400 [Ktedonosporobacter rubrisoli]|uniref:Uncharacterized protein n=1 Tax=Ktedonosporobacter rubrisoli TaxID=2509675 RepID=A0A4P6K0F6_KTERU|nr:hypothetical protein [Ktedonosporobacter rubrisoli]QBD81529.1 hypothetical protein EPA93_38400 [Ktedonosporobacter rubrisoli]
MKSLPYRPEVNLQQLHAFDECLRHIPGSWNSIGRSFIHAGAPGVIRLRWQIAGERWCDEPGFLDFLDQRHHRLLLGCFLQEIDDTDPAEDATSNWPRTWQTETLLKQMGPAIKARQLAQALHFLELQEYIVAQNPDEWASGSLLEHIEDLNPTFAWSVQAHLQQSYHALVRRCVSFKEWQTTQLNDLDVLAFTEDGRAIIVECKLGQHVSLPQVVRFVQRAQAFPADIALLLLDTEEEAPVIRLLQQINTILNRDELDLGHKYTHKGSLLYHLTDNFYVANTAGGIASALEAALQFGSNSQQSGKEAPNEKCSSPALAE